MAKLQGRLKWTSFLLESLNTPSVSKQKVTFGHNLCYETNGTFGEISLKLRQMNWNVARNNVNVVDDELPS
jgi:hypothetical protein